jgi:hypothetical protein
MARRKPQGRQINPTYYVFCEGETEKTYVKHLKSQYRIPIEIDSHVTKNKISTRYINAYLKSKPRDDKDKIFLMYDLDVPEMFDKIRRIPGILLASNPCVEYWFLLHHKDQTAELTSKACVLNLCALNSSYKKGALNNDLKRLLVTNKEQAIIRAKAKVIYNNPSSTVYKLIESLESIASLKK